MSDGTPKPYTLAEIGGKSIEYEEILVNDQVRVLRMILDDDTALVQIRGTHIVPEFDSVVIFSLTAVGMTAAIAIFLRARYPKIK